jgi:phage-related protein
MKSIVFHGDSLTCLRRFPDRARRGAGYQLDRVQRGLDPDDWKPMTSIGKGVREIRVRDISGAYRVIYVATFRDAVHVLHAFLKKAQRTSPSDLNVAISRFRALRRGMQV